ncbi:hypothetical protein [Sphingomonas sp. Leaf20]|uniref:hypothetical protein n=1 Tax=Sphingomonas sp. Leaf20 TaxID=1735685 RepID=UPI0012E1B736|nr:hypothetical protein [Sphingomonas sp. Leaf20]
MKGNEEAAQIASAILSFRRYRSRALSPNIFGEPAWELLLEVFVADAVGAPMIGRIAAERNEASPNVMSRWLRHLSSEGLLVGDGDASLDDELTLSGSGMAAIEAVLLQARSLKDGIVPTPSVNNESDRSNTR